MLDLHDTMECLGIFLMDYIFMSLKYNHKYDDDMSSCTYFPQHRKKEKFHTAFAMSPMKCLGKKERNAWLRNT